MYSIMIDINKQIIYWKEGASEDFEVARELISNKRSRHGLFFVHLALEKMIKAHICKNIKDIAPRIHNLIRLSEVASLKLEQSFIDILAELNAFSIEGRYPDSNNRLVSFLVCFAGCRGEAPAKKPPSGFLKVSNASLETSLLII